MESYVHWLEVGLVVKFERWWSFSVWEGMWVWPMATCICQVPSTSFVAPNACCYSVW